MEQIYKKNRLVSIYPFTFDYYNCLTEIYYIDEMDFNLLKDINESFQVSKLLIPATVYIYGEMIKLSIICWHRGKKYEKIWIYNKNNCPNLFRIDLLTPKEIEIYEYYHYPLSYNDKTNCFESKVKKEIYEIFDDWKLTY